MSDLRTAAQQALEALDCPGKAKTADEQDAITALKAALAEPVQEHEDWCASVTQLLLCDPPRKAPCNCKKKVAEPVQEPVQEPVVWMYEDTLPKEYPYDAMWSHSAVRDGVRMFPVFAPPQRKPLTEEEIKDCETQAMVNGALPFEQRVFFARAIERAHGIGGEE